MSKQTDRRHLVDILFVLALFAVFALCGLLLIILGTHLYEKNIQSMNLNYANRTSYAYFTEKIRQSDQNSRIYVDSASGYDILCIEQVFNGNSYITYLYEDENHLKEYFTRLENSFSPESGKQILDLSNLTMKEIEPKLFYIHFLNEEQQPVSLYISTSS